MGHKFNVNFTVVVIYFIIVIAERINCDEIQPNTKELDSLILGQFTLTSDPEQDDFVEIMKAMEYGDNGIARAKRTKQFTIIIEKNEEDNIYTVFQRYNPCIRQGKARRLCNRARDPKFKFIPGEEFIDRRFFDEREYNGTISFEGNNKMIRNENYGDFTCQHVYKFSEDGFELTYGCKGKSAVQEFERVKNLKIIN